MASSKTCFVIMPIGTQSFGDVELTASQLRLKYDDLIKEAISRARNLSDFNTHPHNAALSVID